MHLVFEKNFFEFKADRYIHTYIFWFYVALCLSGTAAAIVKVKKKEEARSETCLVTGLGLKFMTHFIQWVCTIA